MLNYAGKMAFDKAAKENLDPDDLHRIARENRQVERDIGVDARGRKLCHRPGPDIDLKDQAEREAQWTGIAATISRAKDLIRRDTISGKITCEQRDFLNESAEALTPAIQKAMARKREHSDEYTKLFDERAKT